MKVKKKYIFLGIFAVILLLLIAFGISAFILNKLNLSVADGIVIAKNELSLLNTNNEEIKNYNDKSQFLYDVLHYDINIQIFSEEEKIKGKTKITFIPKDNFEGKVILNLRDNFNILNFIVNNTKLKYKFDDDKLTFNIPKEKYKITDTSEIIVEYKGEPESLGFGSFVFDENKGKSLVYTLNEPIYASTWFPCNDLPFDKVLFDIHITNDSSKISVSNGKLVSVERNKNQKTYHWKTEYPIATYLISFYSADYEYFNEQYISSVNDTMNIDYYVFEEELKNAKTDFSIHSKAMEIFSELFGEYPFIKEKYGVAEFTWNLGAMEHQTITGLGKNFISGRKFFTSMLVHELAHQWWGNAVTPKTWKDIWLNEGFATYSEALYYEKLSGKSALNSTMVSFRASFGKSTLYNPEKLFSRAVYNKGAWVLHMLRREVGDSTFFEILRNYYETFKYKNASTEDFIKIAEKSSNKDLEQFFKQWVYKGKGILKLEYSYEMKEKNGKYKITLKINQTQKEYENYEFNLDLSFYLSNQTKDKRVIKISDKKSVHKFIFKERVTKIDVDPENWLATEIENIEN